MNEKLIYYLHLVELITFIEIGQHNDVVNRKKKTKATKPFFTFHFQDKKILMKTKGCGACLKKKKMSQRKKKFVEKDFVFYLNSLCLMQNIQLT